MSEIEESGVLKYGDIVKFSCEGLYLFSKGVANPELQWSEFPTLNDYTLGLFKILPRTYHVIENKLLNSKEALLSKFIAGNKESLRMEILNNIHHQSKLLGTPVTIGSNLDIVHLPSNKFLGVDLSLSSNSSKDLLKFKLQETSDDNTMVKIEAVFNFQKEKLKVMDGDKVYLDVWNSTMHANLSLLKQDKKAIGSFEAKSRIKVSICSKYEFFDESQIFNWNHVFIKDSENNFALVVEGNEPYFWHDFDLNSSLWRIESENPDGVMKESLYKIRHISSKLYLQVEIQFVGRASVFSNIVAGSPSRLNENYKVILGNGCDSNSDWSFLPLNYSGASQFIKSQICALRNADTGLYLTMNYFQLQRCYPCLQDNIGNSSYFQVFKCNDESSMNVLFADEVIIKLNSLFLQKVSEHWIRKLMKNILMIKKYCLNQVFSIMETSTAVGEPSRNRQNILRVQGVIETLCKFLQVLSENKLEQLFLQAASEIFDFFVCLCMNNPENKLALLDHSVPLKEFLQYKSDFSNSLHLIIKDFKECHLKKLDSIHELITEHIKILIDTKDPAYFPFLDACCICHTHAIPANQELIQKLLFVHKPQTLMIPVLEGKTLILEFSEKIPLENCFKNKDAVIYEDEINFFSAYLETLGNLCSGRNYNCINIAKNWFPSDVLLNYAYNENISDVLRSSFLNLFAKIVIDVHPRHMFSYPSLAYHCEVEFKPTSSSKVSPFSSLPSCFELNLEGKYSEYSNPDTTVHETFIEELKENLIESIKNFPQISVFSLKLLEVMHLMVEMNLFKGFKSDNEHTEREILVENLGQIIGLMDMTSMESIPLESYTSKNSQNMNLNFLDRNKPAKNNIESYSRKLLKHFTSLVQVNMPQSSIVDSSLLEILQSFQYFLDWRQEKILQKILKLKLEKNNLKKILNYIPNVIKTSSHESSLALFSKEILITVSKLFVFSSNFKVKALCTFILTRCCMPVAETLSNLKRLLSLAEIIDLEVYEWAKTQKFELANILEKSELWVFVQTTEQENTAESLLKLLETYSQLLHTGSFLSDRVPIAKNEKISSLRQKMYFNLKIHSLLMSFISENSHFLPESPNLKRILQLCFEVLKKMIQGNEEHQSHFYKHVSFFCSNLEFDIGQIEVIIEVLKNNAKNCNSVDNNFMEIFKESILKHGRQARFIKIFECIQVVNGATLLENQLKVMNLILDRQHYKYFCYSKGSKFIEFHFEVEMPGDQPFYYHAALISVLSECAKGVADIELNESKCMQIIPLEIVFSLLNKAHTMPQYKLLRLPLLEFLLEVYFDSKFKIADLIGNKELIHIIANSTENMQFLIQQELEILVKIMRLYMESYLKMNELISSESVHGEIIRFLQSFHSFYEEMHFTGDTTELVKNLAYLAESCEADLEFVVPYEPEIAKVPDWEEKKSLILNDADLKKYIRHEKKQICNLLIEINETFYTIHEITEHLLYLIEFYKVKSISKKAVCRAISIIKAMINDKKLKEKARKEIIAISGIYIILKVLSEADTHSLVYKKLLKLSIHLLKKGDFQMQSAFYSFFTTFPESESFFCSLSQKLEDCAGAISTKDQTKFTEFCTILSFLKLLCENHNTLLQNYLRYQEKSLSSYNFISKTLNLLESLIKSRLIIGFKPISLSLDLLTEMCQGPCPNNQKFLTDSKFIEIISSLLSIDESSEDLSLFRVLIVKESENRESHENKELLTGWMVARLKQKALITMLSLLEGNMDKYIISRIIRSTNMEILKLNLKQVYLNYKKQFGNEYSDSSFAKNEKNVENIFILEFGFMVYHLMRIFQENATEENRDIVSGILPELEIDRGVFNYLNGDLLGLNSISNLFDANESNREGEFEESARFFEFHTGNVDVVFTGDVICKTYFWLNPECHNLNKEIKTEFYTKADRSSDKNKLVYLLSRADDIIEHIQHENYIAGLITRHKLIALICNIQIWKQFAFIFALILNGYILGYYSNYDQDKLNLTLSQFQKNSYRQEKLFHSAEVVHLICSIVIFIFYYLKHAPVLYKKNYRKYHTLKYTRVVWSLVCIHLNIDTVYVFCYLAFSFLGSFLHVFYFSFHLLDFLYKYPTLQNVIYSVVLPWKSLLMLYCLILISIYIFSIIAYIYYYEYFLGNCDGLLLCAISCFVQGMKNSGGVGFYMYWNNSYVGELHVGQFFFENLYNIIIMIIMFSILAGTIISTFAVLRKINEANLNDQISKCFICGLTKDVIEASTKKPFKFHRKYEHNEWNYIFFILYLKSKHPSEYSGIETLVAEEVKKGGINWIPQGRGFSLELQN